jgi:hypothetical protein
MSTESQQIFVSVNGTLSSDQSALNLVQGPGVTIQPRVGGGVLISASGGITPGSLSPLSEIPEGSIPGQTFTTSQTLVTATVYINGLAQLPTSYSQNGTTFTLATPLVENDAIMIQGWFVQ